MIKKKTVKKVKVQKTKETKNPEKSLEDQLLMKDEKIQELEENPEKSLEDQLLMKDEKIQELEEKIQELKKSYNGVLENAKAYYFQESIFSSKFSVEILADTQKLFGLDTMDILF